MIPERAAIDTVKIRYSGYFEYGETGVGNVSL